MCVRGVRRALSVMARLALLVVVTALSQERPSEERHPPWGTCSGSAGVSVGASDMSSEWRQRCGICYCPAVKFAWSVCSHLPAGSQDHLGQVRLSSGAVLAWDGAASRSCWWDSVSVLCDGAWAARHGVRVLAPWGRHSEWCERLKFCF